ncbi:MAG: ADP-ribosylglycohydrolase family protein [Colwellia sp.]|nr:ADP-ribosylglycohydrolase family protein [Colwellia sp.]MCW9082755.1 ADP-ribosylglycohydrolase family protein [Colwellia sp.]
MITAAIIGDYVGSIYEFKEVKEWSLLKLTSAENTITDESVMIAATCQALLEDKRDFAEMYLKYGNHYPELAWGHGTKFWLQENDPDFVYNSSGNGAATRAIPIAYLNMSLEEVLDLTRQSAMTSHNSQEAIDGALAMVYTIWSIRNGNKSRDEIFAYLLAEYGYLMKFYSIEQLRKTNEIDSSAINTVPVAIWLAFEANGWLDSIGLVLDSIGKAGGDIDSILCMTSAIASVLFNDVDERLENEVQKWLFSNVRYQQVLQATQEFDAKKDLLMLPF